MIYTEETVEYRVVAYADFIFGTALKFLSPYADAYGFDVRAEAQDITQEVISKVLATVEIGDLLGAKYFKSAAENACKNALRAKRNDNDKAIRWGSEAIWIERPDRTGWIDLAQAIRDLPQAQREAIAERFFGWKTGEISGSPAASRQALMRAKKALAKQMKGERWLE